MGAGIMSTNFEGATPGRVVTVSPVLQSVAAGYVQPGWRLMITDNDGWRVAQAGSISTSSGAANAGNTSGWMRLVYRLVLEPGAEALLAEPAPGGHESQSYISEALQGEPTARWSRHRSSGDIRRATHMVGHGADGRTDPAARH